MKLLPKWQNFAQSGHTEHNREREREICCVTDARWRNGNGHLGNFFERTRKRKKVCVCVCERERESERERVREREKRWNMRDAEHKVGK